MDGNNIAGHYKVSFFKAGSRDSKSGIMNDRDLFIRTMNGFSTETIPFAARLDIWYKANKRKGTLPEKYARMN
jgi:hypothetical protein